MAIASTIAGSALGGAMGNMATEQLLHKLMGGIGGVLKSDFVKETAQNVMKQSLPNWGGVGYREEAEFYGALNLLAPDDQNRVKRVVMALRTHKVKHLQRWWMILATKTVEGVMWDPQGHAIIPSAKQSHETDVWGLPKQPTAHGKTKGLVFVAGTPADPRVIALQDVANRVREPHGSDANNPKTLYDREGNPLPLMTGDSPEAVEYAAEHLRVTILEDYHFYSFLLKWWQDTDHLKNLFSKARDVVQTQMDGLLTFWIASEIGKGTLQDILTNHNDIAERQKAIEECLKATIQVKKQKIAKKGLMEGPRGLLITFIVLFIVGGVLLSFPPIFN